MALAALPAAVREGSAAKEVTYKEWVTLGLKHSEQMKCNEDHIQMPYASAAVYSSTS